MNLKMIGKYISHLLLAEGFFMLPSLLLAIFLREGPPIMAFSISALACLLLGLAGSFLSRRENSPIYTRESFVVAGLGWLVLSLFGALPFMLSGEIPHFIDAFFETVSGFTTTGASILTDVEALHSSMLFWRSATHWLGGIGVLFFILLVVQAQQGKGFTMHLLRAETPGPQVGKVLPKTRDSVRVLFLMYVGLSLLNLFFLLLGGMPLLEAFCTMMGTAGTGGFGIKNDSLASYSPYLQNVTTVFMALFGINFTVYYFLVRRQWKQALRDQELHLYLGILIGGMAFVSLVLFAGGGVSLPYALQHGAFAVSSVMTTTGYATADFNLWPQPTRVLLLLLMIFGGMAGSTAGGVKSARLLILTRSIKAGLHNLLHPRSIKAVKINGKLLDEKVLRNNTLYFMVYAAIAALIFLLLSFNGLNLETNLSAMLSCFNNVGPGLGLVGPVGNYSVFAYPAKFLLSVAMLMGRLEIFPLLVLFLPGTWRRD